MLMFRKHFSHAHIQCMRIDKRGMSTKIWLAGRARGRYSKLSNMNINVTSTNFVILENHFFSASKASMLQTLKHSQNHKSKISLQIHSYLLNFSIEIFPDSEFSSQEIKLKIFKIIIFFIFITFKF